MGCHITYPIFYCNTLNFWVFTFTVETHKYISIDFKNSLSHLELPCLELCRSRLLKILDDDLIHWKYYSVIIVIHTITVILLK